MNKFIVTDYGVKENCNEIQNEEFQKVLDMCKDGGGTVVVPPGEYKISSVRMWSNTTLYLMNGAKLIGSENCNDYIVYELPENFRLYTDQQAFYREGIIPYKYYRRAMIHAYGEKNISIIGEGNSVIDGVDCFDPDGEEHFRGPHGIFMSGCTNVTLKGYTIQNSGNFMHQMDNCENVIMTNVCAIGGHDGIHLHRGRHFVIKDCLFRTGDDCIAGADVFDIKVSGCSFNTSCNVFRMGGIDILIEDCVAEGPGYYPHLLTVAQNCNRNYKRTDGRHFTICFFAYFAAFGLANETPSQNIVIRNCKIKDVNRLVLYLHNYAPELQVGMDLSDITFENVEVTGAVWPCILHGDEKNPSTATFRNVKVSDSKWDTDPLESKFQNTYTSIEKGEKEHFYNVEYVNIIEE